MTPDLPQPIHARAATPRQARRRQGTLRQALAWARLAVLALAAIAASQVPAQSQAQTQTQTQTQPRWPVVTGAWLHALSAYAPPKYPEGFSHFEYVRGDAPKGGVLRLRNPDRRSSFDKLNPFTVRGNAPAGISLFMFEPLAVNAQDEPQAMYGLLAEAIQVAPDLSSISFRLRAQARFNDGSPVTPEDVVHSFEQLRGKYAAPSVRSTFDGVERAVVVDARTVRFDLAERKVDLLFTVGGLPVFSRQWGAGKRFDEIVDEPPITSGPYVIDKVDKPRRIEFKRLPGYWAAELGVRRGQFNFDRVIYRMYSDQAVAREAFKAGEFDLFKEYGGRSWLRQHQGAKWRDGRIAKQAFETEVGQGLQSKLLNLRQAKWQDARVREAIGYTYDFETIGAKIPLFKRCNSLFSNSPFAAEGLPGPGELKLLEPWRAELPPRVFGPAYVAPRTDGGPNALRQNLLKARELLQQAGWTLAADGKLRNAKGEAFEIEYLTPSAGGNTDWERNLGKLGIGFKERVVDFALYRRRLENFDYDVVTIVEGDFTLPDATALASGYGSRFADEPGSNNLRGVKSKAVDALLQSMGRATTLDELRDAARALDRVVMWSFYQVPDLYNSTEPASYWNRFGRPAVQPKYFSIDTSGFGPWPLMTWWDLAATPGAAAR
jgi:microcin C transport system substrate-binding protein